VQAKIFFITLAVDDLDRSIGAGLVMITKTFSCDHA
jgi:hypothetical protein